MTENTDEGGSKITEHEYLAQEHRHHNWLIHTNLYLTIIFIGGMVQYAYIDNTNAEGDTAVFTFATVVIVALGLYMILQLLRRERIKTRKAELEDKLNYSYHDKYIPSTAMDWAKAIGLIIVFYVFPFIVFSYHAFSQ